MKILAVDVGGTHVKILATGQKQKREIVSGPKMTARQMVSEVKKLAEDWAYEAVSVGFPGPVLHGRPVTDPHNLGHGWVGFDFASGFGLPARVVNDAAMQALGSSGRKDVVPGIGNGTWLCDDRKRHCRTDGARPFAKKGTYEDYVGDRGLERVGKRAGQTV
jgi:polyphosphate glucokinase